MPTTTGANRREPIKPAHPAAKLSSCAPDSSLRWIDFLTNRSTNVIPNFRKGEVLEAGDRLLSLSKLEEMRSTIPNRRRRAKVRKLPKDAAPEA